MEQTDFIVQALNLTLFGMGFVFLFLTLLVGVTKLMSMIIQKFQSKVHDQQDFNNNSELEDEIDEETKFVIEQAIKMHRGHKDYA
ncbi:sodium pump decarboxylase, gamma subunit [Candidatus Ruthia magnifica str. Cm (Calyptogena magnifica)]|uniref:Oxaloacetate decarboxylase gamma chain n=1 Tax=Ruthia magnifica subsp. Calyptogena magnifica TaxID=413404 RepID=A1AXA9_RUTMC|nr:OadG family protein [Candidatus Ruthturnera calyptogenae]ABL02566.1 sodium pump decarboxylase, gamma subunit [Candidatus Ruthia magnifica str. Cm (Calyptogena magnifica)]